MEIAAKERPKMKLLHSILILSSIVFINISNATGATVALVQPGSMCMPTGELEANDQCLAIDVNGVKNLCDTPKTIVCPLVLEPIPSEKYKEAALSVYSSASNPVKARVIWHSSFSWQWGTCAWDEAVNPGANYLFPPICGPVPQAYAYTVEVVLPTANSWVYFYVPIPK